MSDLFSGLSEKVPHRQDLGEFLGKLKRQKNADRMVQQKIKKLEKILKSDTFRYIDPSLIKLTLKLNDTLSKQQLDLEDYKKQVAVFVDAILANKHLVRSYSSIAKLAGSLNDSTKNFEYHPKLREICKIFVSFELQARETRIRKLLDEIERETGQLFIVADEDDESNAVADDDDAFLKPEISAPPTSKTSLKKNPFSKLKRALKPKKNKDDGYKTGRLQFMSVRVSVQPDKSSWRSYHNKRTRSQTSKITLLSATKSYFSSLSSSTVDNSLQTGQAISPTRLESANNPNLLITEKEFVLPEYEGNRPTDSGYDSKSYVDFLSEPSTRLIGIRLTDSGYDSKSDADSLLSLREPSPRLPSSRLTSIPSSIKTPEKGRMVESSGVISEKERHLPEPNEIRHGNKYHFDSKPNEAESNSFSLMTDNVEQRAKSQQQVGKPTDKSASQHDEIIQDSTSELDSSSNKAKNSYFSHVTGKVKKQAVSQQHVEREAKKSGDETSTERNKPKNISKQSIIGCDAKDTMIVIIKIVEKIRSYKSEVVFDGLEICGCELEKKHLERLKDLNQPNCTISKLAVKNFRNMTDLIPLCCEIFDKYSISSLNLESDNLKNDDIDKLRKHLGENKTLKKLNLSSNRNIGEDGYKQIGCIVKEHGITDLKVADCDITTCGLTALFSAIEDTKLEGLDLSCSKKLKLYDFEYIGKFVASNGVKRLKMSGCHLTEEAIWQICKQNHPLDELDVSYNPTMESEAYETLGTAAKTCQIKKLGLAGCELTEDDLSTFRESIRKHTMSAMNVGDNSSIASGIAEVGKIARNCELEEVDISDCMLVDDELKNFKKELYPEQNNSHKKLKRLSLGDYGRQLGQEYVSEVCELLPQIEERLNLRFGFLQRQCWRMLQEKLDQLGANGLQLYLNNEQMKTLSGKRSEQ